MIDLHSHILPGVDDGARDAQETFKMLKEAKEAGFTTVVSTSHYFLGHYEKEEDVRKTYIDAIQNKVNELGLGLRICIGSEIYITNSIVDLIEEKKASTINNTKYVLFELPFEHEAANLKDVIYDLLGHNYIPIIAHPERYKYVQKNPNLLIELIDLGVLFQSNFGSLIGFYGKEPKKTVKLLLENNFIHFLSSDAHRQENIYKLIPEAIEELKKILPQEKIEEITEKNQNLVLQNKKIIATKPTKVKKHLFNL